MEERGSLQSNQILDSVCFQWNGKSFTEDGSEQSISVCHKVQPIGTEGRHSTGTREVPQDRLWEMLGILREEVGAPWDSGHDILANIREAF